METPGPALGRGAVFAGRFELIEELGAGGMGVVYRAFDKKVGEEIALKLLHPEIARDERTVERFRNEIKLARRITHKNVCRMHELHEEGQTLFITMEYVSGQDLKGLIKERGALPTGKAISIAKQVCEGLAEAHDLGVIHRDLKPQNIMVDGEGNAKIMDFGIARSLRAIGMTAEGSLVGTPDYMSPEQVEGKEADQRSDIYALGVILFEMATGRVPFEGDSPLSVAFKHKNEVPVAPRTLNAEVLEPFNKLILRCLEKEKENRYQTADELLGDLVRIEEGLPISERVVLKARPTIHITREKPTGIKRFLAPALVLLVLVIAGALVWRFLLRPDTGGLVNMENSIAIISFENQTGDPAFDDYRKMIPSRLITSLEPQSFYVISMERMRDILKQIGKGGAKFIDSDLGFEVCRKEGVKSLVTGVLYRAGETFMTDVQILDVRTRKLLRTAKAQGPVDSIINSQVDELSRQIAASQGVAKERIDASVRPVGEFGTSSAEAYNYYFQGSEYYDNWDYNKAREFARKAVEIDPEFAMAYYLLGSASLAPGVRDRPAAIQAFEKARSLSKNVTEKEKYQIEINYAAEFGTDREKVASLVKEYAAKYPKEKEAHAYMGVVSLDSDPEKAVEEYNIALRLDPNYGPALQMLGYIFQKRKDYPKAVDYFLRWSIAEPEDPNALQSLANGYFCVGKIAEAKAALLKMVEKFPQAYNFDLLEYIYALEENYGETLRLWDKLLEGRTPGEKRAVHLYRGFYRGWIGDLKGSLSDLQQVEDLGAAMAVKPNVAPIMRLRTWVYLDQHELDLSRKSLGDYRAYYSALSQNTAPYDASYNEMLGNIECAEGKADSAEQRWKEMEALIPKVAAASQMSLKYRAGLLRAEVGLAQGRTDEVIGFLTKTPPPVEAFSDDLNFPNYNTPFLKDALARAYVKKGDLDKAIAEYERLTTFDYRNETQFLIHPKYHYRLGLLYEQKGRKAKAAERYRKFLDLWKAANPSVPEVADAKKRIEALDGVLLQGKGKETPDN